MIKLLFSLVFSVTFARWTYEEVKILAPFLVPGIDLALEKIQIPTHNNWSNSLLARVVASSDAKDGNNKNKRIESRENSQCTQQADRAEISKLIAVAEKAFSKY